MEQKSVALVTSVVFLQNQDQTQKTTSGLTKQSYLIDLCLVKSGRKSGSYLRKYLFTIRFHVIDIMT